MTLSRMTFSIIEKRALQIVTIICVILQNGILVSAVRPNVMTPFATALHQKTFFRFKKSKKEKSDLHPFNGQYTEKLNLDVTWVC